MTLQSIMKLKYLLLMIVTAIVAACSSPDHKLLVQADSVIIDHPDSAMAILRKIDRNRLGKNDLPYYSLLFSQAQVETGIKLDSDSLIKIAWEKYADDTRGDKGIRSLFYLAESYYNQVNDIDIKKFIKGTDESKPIQGKALKYYLQAYEGAKRQGNDYWHARSANRIKILFWSIDNYEAERYAREAVEYFKKSGRKKDHRTGILHHAILLLNLEKYDLEREELDSLRQVILKEEDPDSLLLSSIDDELRNLDRKLERLREEGVVFLSNEDVNEMRDMSSIDAVNKILNRAKINKYGEVKYILPSKVKRDLKMELTEVRRDFYDDISMENAENADTFQRLLWIAVIVFLTITIILSCMFYFRYKAQKAKMSANFESFLSLKATSDKMSKEIEERTDTIHHMKLELEEKYKMENTHNQLIRELLKEKWSTLDMLCDELFDLGQSDAEKKRVLRNIEKELNKIISPQSLTEIIDDVDTHMGGMITRLRGQCPFLKDTDINFLGLIYAGFSVRAVCMFTDMEYRHFYVKKSRLIKRIQNSDAPDKDTFISLLNKK